MAPQQPRDGQPGGQAAELADLLAVGVGERPLRLLAGRLEEDPPAVGAGEHRGEARGVARVRRTPPRRPWSRTGPRPAGGSSAAAAASPGGARSRPCGTGSRGTGPGVRGGEGHGGHCVRRPAPRHAPRRGRGRPDRRRCCGRMPVIPASYRESPVPISDVRARAGPDRPRDHPQLLHHRAHRPRQVDAGRPDAAADRRRRRAQRAGAVPRPDGHRARARHHDQEPGRPDAVDGAGRQRRGRRARHLRAQHDRHPRPRRLHLRGVPLARGVRGRGAARRRRAGHRGADAGQPLPRARRRPAHHPGAQQDRPAVSAQPEKYAAELAAHHRLRRRPTCCRCRPRPASGVERPAQRDRRADPAAGRRRRRAAARADLRLGLRHLPRRGHLRPGRSTASSPTATGSR